MSYVEGFVTAVPTANKDKYREHATEARDEAWSRLKEDKRMQPNNATAPFDGQRMIYGGFQVFPDS